MLSKYNILLVSLMDEGIKEVSLRLAEKLDYFYLNAEDMIDYSLFDKEKMENVCGLEYLAGQENKIIRSLNNYEKTVISMNYQTFSNNIESLLTRNIIIYVKVTPLQLKRYINKLKNLLPKDENKITRLELSEIVFEERDKFIKNNCAFTVKYDIQDSEKTTQLILDKLREQYEN